MAQLENAVVLPEPSIRVGTRRGPLRRVAGSASGIRVLSVMVVLALWEIIGVHFPYETSSPWAVAVAIDHYLVQQVLPGFGQTLESFGLGFGICVVFGVPIGLAMARIRIIRVALEPYVVMFYSLPMLAIFPLLIVAFGINFELRVAACVLFGIFAIITNVFIGASRVDPTLEDVGRTFVASGWKRLTTIIFPGSLDYIFAGIRVGFGHAMIGAVVIEMEASIVGMGFLLQRYAHVLNLAAFFVVVVVLGLFSVLFSVCLKSLQRWATAPWDRSHRLARTAVGQGLSRWADRSLGAAADATVAAFRRLALGVGAAVRPVLRPLSWAARAVSKLVSGGIGAWGLRLAVVVAIVGFWQLESRSVSRAVLAAPWTVAKAVYHMFFISHAIYGPMLNSLEVFGAGFGLSMVIGVPVGLAMGRRRTVEHALDPYVSFLYALPIVVFVPIMVIWLGFGFNFGVAFVLVSAVFAVIINTMQGVHSVDPELIETARSFCASERDILRTVVLPSVVPFVIAGGRMAFSVSWIGVIVSEVISSQTGLGGMITTYATRFLLATMFVPMLVIIALSVIIVGLSNRLTPRLTPWFDERGT